MANPAMKLVLVGLAATLAALPANAVLAADLPALPDAPLPDVQLPDAPIPDAPTVCPDAVDTGAGISASYCDGELILSISVEIASPDLPIPDVPLPDAPEAPALPELPPL